jgi:hypothetical protein
MSDRDFARLEILPFLPSFFSHYDDKFPEDLIGATILRIGTLSEEARLEGGGLVIDYQKAGDDKTSRVVFAFNELGMWAAWNGQLGIAPNPNAVR